MSGLKSKKMKKITLAVIFGGKSSEHEVSLSSAQSVLDNLNREKYNSVPVAITKGGFWLIGEKGWKYLENNKGNFGRENAIKVKESNKLAGKKDGENRLIEYGTGKSKRGIDLVLPMMHGEFGEDGKLQGMLEMMRLPYVFSGVLAHALAMDKSKAKTIAQAAGVPVAQEVCIKRNQLNALSDLKLDYPLVVKPNQAGSSVGISLVEDEKKLKSSVQTALRFSEEVLLEKYIQGRELTVTVLEKR
ncbi:MAG: D-alanine--D-alanine ligase A, partial [Candidatus Moraniibacteriota bacterium]